MPPSSSLFATLLALCGLVSSVIVGPTTNLHVINANVSPDGVQRSAVLASADGRPHGVLGPVITAKKGDTFKINVINELHDSSMYQTTSIHWHGFIQQNTNYLDGTAFVSQCPIAANHSFTYQFGTNGQAGTYWYHSHLSTQYCDGLRGAMVVYDPNDPYKSLYDVDDETTIMTLIDWYHFTAKSVENTVPVLNSVLINGLGRFQGNPTSELAVVKVCKGKRYRIRLINAACDPNFIFQIEHHNFTIIEVDGVNHKPLSADSIQIFAGQRYSFVLNANQPIGNYWIRALPNFGADGFAGGINSAILRYVGAPNAEPTGDVPPPSVNPLLEQNLRPLVVNPKPIGGPGDSGVDLALNLDFGFDFDHFKYLVNGHPFVSPSVPVLLQLISGAQTPANLLPTDSIIPLPRGKTVQLSMPGGVPGPAHPFHLHGHNFQVVRSANSSTYNYINPPVRDVVSIGVEGDNVTIRFRTDNPGPWFLHCHIEWHFAIGLGIVFAEDAPGWNTSLHPPPAWNQLCPIFNNLTPDQL